MKLTVPPPIVGVFCCGLAWLAAAFFPGLNLQFPFQLALAVLFAVTGLGIDLVSVAAFFRKKTTITPLNPEKTESLVTGGLYTVSRNPMYLGMALIIAGWVIYLGNVAGIAGIAAFVWYITTFQIKPEENALLSKFGDDYTAYCQRVRRWV